jgi:hypothetical protein
VSVCHFSVARNLGSLIAMVRCQQAVHVEVPATKHCFLVAFFYRRCGNSHLRDEQAAAHEGCIVREAEGDRSPSGHRWYHHQVEDR